MQNKTQQDIIRSSIRLQGVVLIIAIMIFGIKLVAWFYTHSLAVLSDALESIVNIISGALGLFSLSVASRPRDAEHPYGHAKAEYLSSAAEGIFILIAGLYIIYEAIKSFFLPAEVMQLRLGVVLMAVTALINLILGSVCASRGRQNNSLQLTAASKHLKTDALSTAAIIAGLILMHITGYPYLDGIIALIAAIFIIVTGTRVLRVSIGGMMDEADEELLERMVARLNEKRRENWIDLHNVRIIKLGNTLHCDFHLTIPWYLNVREAHEEITILGEVIRAEFGTSVEMFVHTDPCVHFSCRICTKRNCHVRQHPLERQIKWTVQNVVRDRKHRL